MSEQSMLPPGGEPVNQLDRLALILYGRPSNLVDRIAGGSIILKDACDTLEKLHALMEEERGKTVGERIQDLEKQRDDALDHINLIKKMVETHCRDAEIGDEHYVRSPIIAGLLNHCKYENHKELE